MALSCAECGTENPDGAAFCSMCRAIFARAGSTKRAARLEPEIELAVEPVPRTSKPAARRDAPVIDSRRIALGQGLVAVVSAEGSSLHVEMHGATLGGVLRSIALAGLGALFSYAAQANASPMRIGLYALAALMIGIALWMLGFTLGHRFDARTLTVERTRTWLGVPLGRWNGTVDRDARVEVVIGVSRRRNTPPVHRLVLHSATGDTTIATGTDLANLGIVGRDIARFCELPTPRNV